MKFLLRVGILCLACTAPVGGVHAANLQSQLSFLPAEAGRTHMDIGGVWDGTAEVATGDRFVFQATNPAAANETAHDFSLNFDVPAGFVLAPGSATLAWSGAGTCPTDTTVSAAQTAAGDEVVITTAIDDLPPDCGLTISVGLSVAIGTPAGNAAITAQLDHALVEGDPTTQTDTAPVTTPTLQGAATIQKEATTRVSGGVVTTGGVTKAAVTDDLTWTVTVENTGLGGLFGVTVDEAILQSRPALSLDDLVQTLPAGISSTRTGDALTLPYLAPGEVFEIDVETTVDACVDIRNTADLTYRGLTATRDVDASVELDPEAPLVTYAPPDVTLDYGGPVTLSLPVSNTGRGEARDLRFITNLPSHPVTVTVITPGWTYDAGTGILAKNDGGNTTLGNSVNETIDLALEHADVCTASGGSMTVIWTADYVDVCGNNYTVPTELSRITPATGPTVSLDKQLFTSDPQGRIEVGEDAYWTLNVDASLIGEIATDPFIVTDILPADIAGASVASPPAGTSVDCGGPCGPGSTLEWSIPLAILQGGPQALRIDFTAPTDACLGGSTLTNTALIDALSSQSCSLDASTSSSALLSNNPDVSFVQNFDTLPLSSAGNTFETGAPDDGDRTREVGEGEFTEFRASYGFGAGYAGTWTGSNFGDDFSGVAGQSLVEQPDGAGAGALVQACVTDSGGCTAPADFVAVPAAAIGSGATGLDLDLGFLAGAAWAGVDAVADQTLILRYFTSATDAVLGGSTGRTLLRRAVIDIQNASSGGACLAGGRSTFTQGVFVSLARASATIAVTLDDGDNNDGVIDVCEAMDVQLRVGNGTDQLSSRIRALLDTGGDYEYILPQPPGYPMRTGAFGSNLTIDENGGANPTFTYENTALSDPGSLELASPGTVTVRMRRKAQTGTTASAVSGSLNHDDNETVVTLSGGAYVPDTIRDFGPLTASDAPVVVREAKLEITVTPDNVPVTGDRAEWTIYVINTGNGTAYGSELTNVVPDGISPDLTATDTANSCNATTAPERCGALTTTTVADDTLTWIIGELAPGATTSYKVSTTVDGTMCSISQPATASTRWGCGGVYHDDGGQSVPNFSFPPGALQVFHAGTSGCALCGNGRVELVVRNTGLTQVRDGYLEEILNPATSGIDYVPGSVEYSTDFGSTWTAGNDPSGAGTTASPYRFDKTQVAAFDRIPQSGRAGSSVRVRFDITAGEQANNLPQISVRGGGEIACGQAVNADLSSYTIPVDRPRIRLTKNGANLTTDTDPNPTFSNTVYAASGDLVRWKIDIRNTGDAAALNALLSDATSGSGGSLILRDESLTVLDAGFSGGPNTIPDIADGDTVTYYIDETLGSACLNASPIADVTWGCDGVAPHLTTPSDNDDDANLVMVPRASDVTVTQAVTGPGGVGAVSTNGEVTVTVANAGAPLDDLVLTDTVPAGFSYDTTFTPVLAVTGASDSAIDGVTVDASTLGEPVFSFTQGGSAGGFLRHDATLTLTYRILQTGGFDTTEDDTVQQETEANSLDPAPPADGTNTVAITYGNTCGTVSTPPAASTANVQPVTPDLDIASIGDFVRLVNASGDTTTHGVTITNRGETAASGTLSVILGDGWSGALPTGCTGAIPGTVTCAVSGLAVNASRSFSFPLTVANETDPLTFDATIEGPILASDGSDTGTNFSLDTIAPRTLGFRMAKTLTATSEVDFGTAAEVQIGEEATMRIEAVWFGSPGDIEGAAITDTLPVELGYVSSTVVGSPSTPAIAAPTPVASGTVTWTLPDFTNQGTFTADIITRVLNVSAVSQGDTPTNTASASFEAAGETYSPTTPGFPELSDRQVQLDVREPVLAMTKRIRNVTKNTPAGFAAVATGEATDVFEYEVRITAPASPAPAFDLSLTDTLPSKLSLVAMGSDGLDNDGDGATDEMDEANYSGQTFTFDEASTGYGLFGELASGQEIVLRYRASAGANVSPNETLVNDADLAADSLDGPTGSQTGATGATDTDTGARPYTRDDSATARVSPVELTKIIMSTGVGGDDSPDVVIGEQVVFQVALTVPASTVEDFSVTDVIPAGLDVASIAAPVVGNAISCASAPAITPTGLPANAPTIEWMFDDCTVAASGDRSIALTYTTQVKNIDANTRGTTLVNEATYTHGGDPPVVIVPVTLTLHEPTLTLTKALSRTTNLDAGDPVTVTLTLANTGDAPAYNVSLEDLLNDNGVDAGADGDVNESVPYGNAARDIANFSCAAGAVTNTTGALGGFTFAYDTGDGDGDTVDENADCAVRFTKADQDGFFAGSTLTATFTTTMADTLVMEDQYLNTALVAATSLPSGATGSGNASYDRSPAADPAGQNRFDASATASYRSRGTRTPTKTFTATSDPNTGETTALIDVAIGETFTVEIVQSYNEGTHLGAFLRDQMRLRATPTSGNFGPPPVALQSATLRRSATDLTTSTDPGGINAAPAGVPVDVFSSIIDRTTGTFRYVELDLGAVVNGGAGAGVSREQHILSLTFRVTDDNANLGGRVIYDRPQMQRFDAANVDLRFRNGAPIYATIATPDLAITKTTTDDRIIGPTDEVPFTLGACNTGNGPAYNVVVEDILPLGLRVTMPTVDAITRDGGALAASPAVSWNAATGTMAFDFGEANVLLPTQCFAIDYTVTADADLPGGSTLRNAANIVAYFSQGASQPFERRQFPRSETAHVDLLVPSLAWTPDHDVTTQPGTSVMFPHTLSVPDVLGGGALSFTPVSSRGLGWSIYYDSNANGVLDASDPLWTNGTPIAAGAQIGFFATAFVPAGAPPGWSDTTTLEAALTKNGQTYRRSVTDITRVSGVAQAGEVAATKSMALDRDCNGSPDSGPDGDFSEYKSAAPAECVVFRITFRNEGTGPITEVVVHDEVPAYTAYVGGSAGYPATPGGLVAGAVVAPAPGGGGGVRWPFAGALQPGASGHVEYGVRIDAD